MGFPVSTTRFVDTEVSTRTAVSTGAPSECPTPSFDKLRERMLIAVAKSLCDFAARQTQSGDRVRVSIRFKSARRTRVFTNPQRFLSRNPTGCALFRHSFWIHRDEVRAFALAFVFEHPQEHSFIRMPSSQTNPREQGVQRVCRVCNPIVLPQWRLRSHTALS